MDMMAVDDLITYETSPLVASIVQTLSQIDLEHQSEIERLQASQTAPEVKWLVAERLKERHRERREPYIRALAKLHRQRVARIASAHAVPAGEREPASHPYKHLI